MNLKEAFRFQNRLEYLIEKAENILDDEDCVTLTKRTYLYKKATSTKRRIPKPKTKLSL